MVRVEVRLPELDMGPVPIVASLWLVEEGAEVSEGDRLLEVSAGSVTVDLSAPTTGTLTEALVAEDDCLEAGQLIGVIETDTPLSGDQ